MAFFRRIFFLGVLSFLYSSDLYCKGTDDDSAKAQAEEVESDSPFTGTFDLTTNYMFRGISQTNNNAAVQGSFTYTFPKWGIYADIWGSNVQFEDYVGNISSLEIDTTLGIANTIDKFTYDLALVTYNYPRSSNLAYNEFIANLQWHFVTTSLGYTNNVDALGGSGIYYNLGVNYTIPTAIFKVADLSIIGGVGYYDLPQQVGLHSYTDYSLMLQKVLDNYEFSFAWTSTDGQSVYERDLTNSKWVFMILYNFG